MKKLAVLIISMMMLVGSLFAEDVVIFEPGVTPAKGGQVVEIDGTKYFKVKCYGYDTSIKIPAVDCSAFTEFEAVIYADKENLKYQATVGIKDKSYADIASPGITEIKVEAQTATVGPAKQESWNTISKTKVAEMLQPMIQDNSAPYNPHNYTIYIGKIVAR